MSKARVFKPFLLSVILCLVLLNIVYPSKRPIPVLEIPEIQLVDQLENESNKSHNITAVTAFFDFNRPSRPASWYLVRLEKTLALPLPFVIYTQPQHIPTILLMKRPKGYPTKIVSTRFSDLPYYQNLSRIKEIQRNKTYLSRIEASDRIEVHEPLYPIIQFSKYHLVLQTSEINPFNSKSYIWIDAGASRFFNTFDLSKLWNDFRFGDRLIVKSFSELFHIAERKKDQESLEEMINYGHHNYIAGTMFAGNLNAFRLMAQKINDIWLTWLEHGIVNNEQIAMVLLWTREPELFAPIKHTESYIWANVLFKDGWGYQEWLAWVRGDANIIPNPREGKLLEGIL